MRLVQPPPPRRAPRQTATPADSPILQTILVFVGEQASIARERQNRRQLFPGLRRSVKARVPQPETAVPFSRVKRPEQFGSSVLIPVRPPVPAKGSLRSRMPPAAEMPPRQAR